MARPQMRVGGNAWARGGWMKALPKSRRTLYLPRMRRLFSYPMLGLLWVYRRFISPALSVFGIKCRHYPSCSAYSVEAIERHGPWAGGWMTLARLLRCHPFTALGATSGVDNVPEHITKAPLWAPWRYGRWRSVYNPSQTGDMKTDLK